MAEPERETVIKTDNEYAVSRGQSMRNSTAAAQGFAAWIKPMAQMPHDPFLFRTKQRAFRFAAWIAVLAESELPDEPEQEGIDFDAIYDAIVESRMPVVED